MKREITLWLNKEATKVLGIKSIKTDKPVEFQEKIGMFIIETDNEIFKIHKTAVLSITEIRKNEEILAMRVKNSDGFSESIISSNGIEQRVVSTKYEPYKEN